ncbi:hypothetical protein K1719_026994 [Acacia pycnantha]|nr:hypothetical protein K1719_026994 [Acacia pycnantha]
MPCHLKPRSRRGNSKRTVTPLSYFNIQCRMLRNYNPSSSHFPPHFKTSNQSYINPSKPIHRLIDPCNLPDNGYSVSLQRAALHFFASNQQPGPSDSVKKAFYINS